MGNPNIIRPFTGRRDRAELPLDIASLARKLLLTRVRLIRGNEKPPINSTVIIDRRFAILLRVASAHATRVNHQEVPHPTSAPFHQSAPIFFGGSGLGSDLGFFSQASQTKLVQSVSYRHCLHSSTLHPCAGPHCSIFISFPGLGSPHGMSSSGSPPPQPKSWRNMLNIEIQPASVSPWTTRSVSGSASWPKRIIVGSSKIGFPMYITARWVPLEERKIGRREVKSM